MPSALIIALLLLDACSKFAGDNLTDTPAVLPTAADLGVPKRIVRRVKK
jgi:hypothetical protein